MGLSTGTKLGPYEILSPLGAGGMGEVWKARDTRLGRYVAVKVLPDDVAADPRALGRFESEARAVAALSHPNILALFDVGEARGVHFAITELLEGETLREVIREGPLPPRKAIDYGVQIADGLASAHEKGIVHRDLKPENLFLTRDGRVKILDFGLARLLPSPATVDPDSPTEARATTPGEVLGTVGYLSPEQIRGLPADARSDIFAFGCVLYEMLSGARAFRRETSAETMTAILREDPPPIAGAERAIPPALLSIVRRCMEKRPEDRFSSAHDLRFALMALSGSEESVSGQIAPSVPAPQTTVVPKTRRTVLRPAILLPVALVLALAGVFGTRFLQRRQKADWARKQAIPEIMRLADQQDYWPAYLLAQKVEAAFPGEPTLSRLWPQFAAEILWQVNPTNADVFVRNQKGPSRDWVRLGRADEKPLWTPIGCMEFKVEKSGYEAHSFAMSLVYGKGTMPLSLAATGELPPGMVRVDPPDTSAAVYLNFLRYGGGPLSEQVGSFLIDTHEVTNRQFKEFVDGGGYRRRELWRHEFVRDGKVIPWEQGISSFVDATGRPGPVTWELGTYPEGKGDFPVTGVSWYEATAFAEAAGKRLPTSYHWSAASGAANSGCIIGGSNFSGKLAAVGSFEGSLNLRGLYDMPGNAREWCSNASDGERIIRGGSFDSPGYRFHETEYQPPIERNPVTGFRCIKLLDSKPLSAELEAPVARSIPDWSREEPFPDSVWKTWLSFLSYTRSPLNAKVELTNDTAPYWRMEKVSFDAAYGGERMVGYLFLPKSAPPPYQAVLFGPGALAVRSTSTENGQNVSDSRVWGYLVKDGRAVFYPVVKGTYERGGAQGLGRASTMDVWVLRAKDIFRSLDYLESRPDIAKERVAYLGFSFGTYLGALPCAVDRRFKVVIFQAGGVAFREELGWAHRITSPVQMINGRYDTNFPPQTSQLPLFRALGTPEKDKRHILLETDHDLSGCQKDVVKANLEWLDRYLGPVR